MALTIFGLINMPVSTTAGLTSNFSPAFPAPVFCSPNSAAEGADLPSPICSDQGFLKNMMTLNQKHFSPAAGLSNLARYCGLVGLTGNPVSAGPPALYFS